MTHIPSVTNPERISNAVRDRHSDSTRHMGQLVTGKFEKKDSDN